MTKSFFKNYKYLFIVFITLLLCFSLGIRFVFLLKSSYEPAMLELFDFNCYKDWFLALKQYPVGEFYQVIFFLSKYHANYPPLYLYFLKFLGLFFREIPADQILFTLFKIPAILADFLIGYLIYFLLKKKLGSLNSILASAFYLLNPGLAFVSSHWGQTDSIYVLFLLTSFIGLYHKKLLLTFILLSLAILMKQQSLVFLPLVFFLSWIIFGYKKTIRGLLIAAITFLVVTSPFIIKGTVLDVFKVIFKAIGHQPMVSRGALNLWYTIFGDWSLILSDIGIFKLTGVGLFGLANLFAFYFIYKNKEAIKQNQSPLIFLSAALISFSFFMLLTEMHERYLFPIFAFLPLIYFNYPKIKFFYWLLATTFFLNLFFPFWSRAYNPFYSQTAEMVSYLVAVINTLIFGFFIIYIYAIFTNRYPYLQRRRDNKKQHAQAL